MFFLRAIARKFLPLKYVTQTKKKQSLNFLFGLEVTTLTLTEMYVLFWCHLGYIIGYGSLILPINNPCSIF